MFIAPTVTRFLAQRSVQFDELARFRQESLEQAADSLGVPHHQFMRAVVLADLLAEAPTHEPADIRPSGHAPVIMAVLPLDHVLDFDLLKKLTGRDLEVLDAESLHEQFADCDAGCLPPFGEPYALEVLYDEALFEVQELIFEAGRRNGVVKIEREAFLLLTRESRRAVISREDRSLKCAPTQPGQQVAPCAGRCGDFSHLVPVSRLKQKIESVYELPVMSVTGRRIMELHHDPQASIDDLAEVVEMDAALSRWIVQFVRSPIAGFPLAEGGVREALQQLPDRDTAFSLALGHALLISFRIAPDGLLGMKALKQHAELTAALAGRIGSRLSAERMPAAGCLLLAGLLHNIGFMLFGHLFHSEFFLLNRMVSANPEVPVSTIERELLGMGQAREILALGHGEIGAWLMERWGLPDEVLVTQRQHHNEYYHGEYEVCVQLVLLATRLLKRCGIGDADSGAVPAGVWRSLGLDEEEVLSLADDFLEQAGIGRKLGAA